MSPMLLLVGLLVCALILVAYSGGFSKPSRPQQRVPEKKPASSEKESERKEADAAAAVKEPKKEVKKDSTAKETPAAVESTTVEERSEVKVTTNTVTTGAESDKEEQTEVGEAGEVSAEKENAAAVRKSDSVESVETLAKEYEIIEEQIVEKKSVEVSSVTESAEGKEEMEVSASVSVVEEHVAADERPVIEEDAQSKEKVKPKKRRARKE